MTKSKTIQEVTISCMESHGKIKSFDEIAEIEEELLSKIEEAFDAHNVVCDKDKKWKVPDSLNAAQIAEVMARGFHIIKVNLCDRISDDEYTLLGLYVDETIAKIIGNDDSIGTYTIEENHLRQIANAFNFLLSSREITNRSRQRGASAILNKELLRQAAACNRLSELWKNDVFDENEEVSISQMNVLMLLCHALEVLANQN